MIHVEEDLRQAQTERTQLQTDLEKTRELCVKLDAGKEAVSALIGLYQSTSKTILPTWGTYAFIYVLKQPNWQNRDKLKCK